MLHQGTSNTCIDFILNNEDSKSNKLSKIQALTQNKLFNSIKNKRGSITNTLSSNLYSLKGLSPFNLGFLISSWEHKTFITSQLLMVNPFDQFGVEEGKIIIDKKFNY
jgi:glucose-6-phosphate isomerase